MKLRSSLSGLMILVAASGLATVIMRFASDGVARFVLTTTILLETAALIAAAARRGPVRWLCWGFAAGGLPYFLVGILTCQDRQLIPPLLPTLLIDYLSRMASNRMGSRPHLAEYTHVNSMKNNFIYVDLIIICFIPLAASCLGCWTCRLSQRSHLDGGSRTVS